MKTNLMRLLSGILIALVSGFLTILVLLGCAAAAVGTNVDRQVNFSQFHTYAWATPDVHYYLPQELEQRIGEWVEYYNHHRYHESLDNLTPADVFFGRKQEKFQ